MIEYRRVTPDDIGPVAEFVIDGMNPSKYPLNLSRMKVVGMIWHMEQSKSDFNLCAFDGGDVVGVVAGLAVEAPWTERCDAHVIACRATSAGVGLRLMRALRDWFMGDMRLQRMLWSMEPDMDERTSAVMERYARRFGFTSSHRVLISYKGA